MKRFLMRVMVGGLAGGLLGGPVGAQNSVPVTVTSPVAVPIAQVVAPKLPPEPSGLAEIAKAKFPLAVVYKEFGLGWRELNWQGTPLFTKGDTHWLNGKEFMVCYQLAQRDARLLTEKDYVAYLTNNLYPFSPEDRFELTLLPTLAIINDVTNGNTGLRSFDPSRRRVVFDAQKGSPAFNQSLTVIYLQKLHAALPCLPIWARNFWCCRLPHYALVLRRAQRQYRRRQFVRRHEFYFRRIEWHQHRQQGHGAPAPCAQLSRWPVADDRRKRPQPRLPGRALGL